MRRREIGGASAADTSWRADSLSTRAMLVWAARRLPDAAVRGLILSGLFILVVVLEIALSSAFHAVGLAPGPSLAAAGACVLTFVLAVHLRLARDRKLRRAAIEAARLRQGLPDGPCCVVWRGADRDEATPWETERGIRAVYPPVARLLGVEGLAIAEFEIDADGSAANIACVDVWPSRIFFRRAAEALLEARFRPCADAEIDPGQRHRVSFVFRIAGMKR